MSDKLIEAFLKMHEKKQLDEAGGVNLQKAKTSPNLLSGSKQTSAITAREPADPEKTFVQKAADVGRGIEAAARSASERLTDFTGLGIGNKPMSRYSEVIGRSTFGNALNLAQGKPLQSPSEISAEVDKRAENLKKEYPTVSNVAGTTADVGSTIGAVSSIPSLVRNVPSLVKGGKDLLTKGAKLFTNTDDAAKVAKSAGKGIDGEITTAMPRSGYKDITPSTPTSAAKTGSEIKPTTSTGPSNALTRPNSSSVGSAMKTVDKVPPRLTGPTAARALPSASDTSKALGGFGKVPMGKVAAVGAGVGAGIAASTLGSSPAGETKAAPAAKPESYKVNKGDTLSDLAKKWNVSVADIAKANQGIKDVHKIGVGQELIKPSATGNKIYQYEVGTKAGPSQSQNIQKPKLKAESTEMTNKLIDAFMQLHSTNSSNLFTEAKKAKKLDPVGKEDEDIDNDGDKDKSDSYLHNRRKAIAKAMKEAKDPHTEGMVKAGTKAPEMTTKPEYATQSKEQTPNRAAKTSLPKGVTAKQTNEAASPMAGQGSSGDKTAKRDLPMLPAASLAGARQASRESGEIGSRQRSMIDSVKKSAFDAKTPGEKVSAFGKALGARVAEPFVKAVDAAKGYETPQSKVVKTGKNSSTVMKNEEVEQLEEAAFKLTDAHKSAITKHLKNSLGKGKVTFHSEHGGHFATHSDGIQSTVHHIQMKNGKMSLSHFMTMDEEFEQLEEMRSALLTQDHADAKDMTPEQKKAKHKKYLDLAAQHGKRMKDQSLTQNQRMASSSVHTAAKMAAAEWKNKYMKEEIEFSEAELEHIASILEANPIAPVPDDYSGAAGGVSKRDLSDETVAEEEMKRGRGRPKGSKSGSKHGSGGDSTVETKNLASQIRFSRPSGGNFTLKHPTTGETKSVPAKAATEFYNKYSGAEKPAQKQAHHDEFVAKHFGSKEKPKSSGISLPKMPAPKS